MSSYSVRDHVVLEVDIGDALQQLIFGSLSRPPEHDSNLFSWRRSTNTVCSWLQLLSIKHLVSGTLKFRVYSAAIVEFCHNEESRYIHGKGELRLEHFRQNHELAEVGMIYMFDLPELCRIATIASSLGITATIPHILEDCCALIFLVSTACEESDMIMKILKGSRAIYLHIAGSFVQNIAAVLVSDAKRLLHLDYPHTFHDVLCVDMVYILSVRHLFEWLTGFVKKVKSEKCYFSSPTKLNARVLRRTDKSFKTVAVMDQLVIWFLKFLSRMKEETSSFSCWLASNEKYVTRQGELIVLIVDWISQRHHILLLHISSDQVCEGVSIIGLKLVDGFRRLITFIFGSLTRPPEAHFMPLSSYGCFSWRRFLEVTSTWCLSMLQRQVGADLLTVLPLILHLYHLLPQESPISVDCT